VTVVDGGGVWIGDPLFASEGSGTSVKGRGFNTGFELFVDE